MLRIVIGISLVLLFSGCTKKVQVDIKPYVTMHKNAQQTTKVNFIEVNDNRETQMVSTILNKDEIIAKYPLSNDLKTWYKEAMIRELKNAKLYDEKNNSYLDVSINIKKIDATYKKYSLDKKNMQVNISLELVVVKGEKIITSNININQSVYKPMILDAEGFESILNESMRDSVSNAVHILIKKL
ncbi:MAG: YajG family lipoprotein [Campylobacterota bacterium]|nr:YajG family lipoprotein [Campylobacterota bacterium]